MTEPIRKSLLPTTPPPEWEVTTVGGKTGAVVRRRVTFGDWEPVLPDHWADEPAADACVAAIQTDTEAVDPTAAIEVWARLLNAADIHVYGPEHAQWRNLTPNLQDQYRKAAAWLLPRLTIQPPPAAAKHRPPCTDGDYCGEAAHCPPAARQTTGQDDTETHTCPDGEPCPGHDTPACSNCDGIDPATCLTHPRPAPAVGQPAEAQDADRAALRERLRLAIAQQYLDDTGSGRTVDELDDTEFGSLADAALRALTVEDAR